MRTRRFSFFAAALGLIVLVAVVNRFSGQVFPDYVLAKASLPAQYLTARVGPLRQVVNGIVHFQSVVKENTVLKDQNDELLMRIAALDHSSQENEFLREVARITQEQPRQSLLAGLFWVQREPAMVSGRINKGSSNDVAVGSTVVTKQGQLIGTVTEVFQYTSRVRLANDAGTEIAGRVLGKATNGIVRGQGTDALKFELIAQGEDIQEGDTIVTAGTDQFPSGLIIGTVAQVTKNESGIFQSVSIAFAADPRQENTVAVLSP